MSNHPSWAFVMQPICVAQNLETHHHELLLRNLEDLAFHGEVIQHAERNGFISIVDFYAASSAIESLERDPLLHLSVNVSSHTVETLGAEYVERIPVTPSICSRLSVELTETRAPEVAAVVAFRGRLMDRGIGFSIDDFGPDYPLDLTQVRNLRPDEIKLSGAALAHAMAGDCSFIDQVMSLGCRVVAECIDTPAKLEFVRNHGIDLVQGYIIHRR